MDPTAQFQSKRVYSLHVFRDISNSNWSNPAVHTFPLSSVSYNKLIGRNNRSYRGSLRTHLGNRDGLAELYKLPSDQLSFLENYLKNLNAEVAKKKAEVESEWKVTLQKHEQEKKAARAAKAEARKQKSIQRDAEKQKADRAQDTAQSDSDSDGTARGGEGRGRRSRKTPGNYPVPMYNAPWIPPPPPPPPANPIVSPALYETPFTLEAVELFFIPEILSLTEDGRIGPYNVYKDDDSGNIVSTLNKTKRLEIVRSKIAPESFTSFSVVLSRCEAAPLPDPLPAPHAYRTSRRRHVEVSPARSYCSYYSGSDDDDYGHEVGVEQDTTVFKRPSEQAEGSENPEKETNENDDEKIETESKAGEEGEDCGEGVIYIKDVTK